MYYKCIICIMFLKNDLRIFYGVKCVKNLFRRNFNKFLQCNAKWNEEREKTRLKR